MSRGALRGLAASPRPFSRMSWPPGQLVPAGISAGRRSLRWSWCAQSAAPWCLEERDVVKERLCLRGVGEHKEVRVHTRTVVALSSQALPREQQSSPRLLLYIKQPFAEVRSSCDWSSCTGLPSTTLTSSWKSRSRSSYYQRVVAGRRVPAPDGLADWGRLEDYSPSAGVGSFRLQQKGFLGLFLKCSCIGVFFSRTRRSWFCPCGPGSLLSTGCAA